MVWPSRTIDLFIECKSRAVSFLKSNSRFLIPLLVVFSAKLIGCVILYQFLSDEGFHTYWTTVNWDTEVQHQILSSAADGGARWTSLFLGWDSSWYLSIAQKGYTFSNQSYAFFPGLPAVSKIVNLFVSHPSSAFVLSSLLTGVLWVPLYQMCAEIYLDRTNALKSTFLYAFFPYVFLFTTVGYAEGLFLLSTLGAWYFHNEGKVIYSMLFASVAAISRPPGLLILLPILIEMLRTRCRFEFTLSLKQSVSLVIPFLSFSTWLAYCKMITGNWFAPFTRSAWNSMYSLSTFLFRVPPSGEVNTLYTKLSEHGIFTVAWLAFLLVIPLLVYAVSRIDKILALYSSVYLLGILVFGAMESVPRFLSFLFPLWLPLATKIPKNRWSNRILFLVCAFFYLIGLFLWLSFLNGKFVS